MWHLVVTTVLIVIFTWFLKTWLRTPPNLPPGPKGIPIFGYLPFLGKKPYITLANLTKKYGDIFMFYIGHERIVVLSTYKLIKEVLHTRGDIFQNRPDSFLDPLTIDSQHGIASNDDLWVQTRRFTLTTLRNFGMGKASLEPKILNEVYHLTEEIKKMKGKPIDLRDLLTMSITNVLYSMMFGQRMDYTNKDFLELISLAKKYMKSIGIDQWDFYLPKFLVKLFGYQTSTDYGMALYKKISLLLKIKLERQQLNQTDLPENFIDAFKIEAKKPNVNQSYFTDKHLAKLLSDLFLAGSDTTSTTIEFFLLYLIKYPIIQKKIQEEIDEIIGQERNPTMADLKLMPYTEAIILEISRIISLAPLSVPRISSKDVDLNGYFIPKGTTIYTNLWALHHNSELFPEPEVFKPKRFLSESNKIKRIDELIPFSIGKRKCPGEGLARMQLFFYLTSLCQHFSFTKEGEVDLRTQYALVVVPGRQKIRAVLRSSLSKTALKKLKN